MKTRLITYSMSLPFGGLMLFFFFLPVIIVLSQALTEPLAAIQRLFADSAFLRSFSGSLLLASTATVISITIGLLIALYLSKRSPRLRRIWLFLMALPLVFSGLIVAYGFILVFGRAGFVTTLVSYLGVDAASFGGFIFSPQGLALAYCYYLIPRAVFILLPVILNFDRQQIKAAESFGATPLQAFFHILFPQLLPAMLTAACLTFAVAFGAYGTALALSGTQVQILPLLLYSRISDGGTDFPVVALIAVILIVVCVLIFILAEHLKSKTHHYTPAEN